MRNWQRIALLVAVVCMSATAFAADKPCSATCKTSCASAVAVACASAAEGEKKQIKVEVESKDGVDYVKVYEIVDGEQILIKETQGEDFDLEDIEMLHGDGEHIIIKKKCHGDEIDIRCISAGDHANVWTQFDGEKMAIFTGGAYMGIEMQELNDQLAEYFEGEGVLVQRVVEDSPAEAAGLKAGDVIVKMGDEEIEESDDIMEFMGEQEVGDEIEVKVLRKGDKKTFKVTLGEREAQDMAFWTQKEGGDHFTFRAPHFEHFGEDGEHKIIMRNLHDDDEVENLRADIEELRAMIEELKKNK